MKIVREQREQNTSLIRVTVGQEDYREEVEKALREYKRKANIPGFRPGMVPMGIIKKMYGKGVLAEQSYRKASNSVFEYLQKENIDYLGDVIPSEEQGAFDFDSGTEFEFVFEIGEAPELKLDLSEKDKLTYYKIKIDKKMHEDFRSNYLRRYGRLVDADAVTSDEALSVTLDNGEMKVEDAYVGLISMPEEERKPFIGKKVGDKMTVNVNELYRTPSQRAAVLQVKEGELEHIKPEFELEITRIRKFAEPELNEEFFKMAFPAGNVTTAEQFEAFIDEQIASELRRESDYLFTLEVRDYLVKKADLKMPEAFLKRWLYTINEGKFTMEEIEKDFDQFLKMFTWNYIQKQIIKQENITVSADEATAEAKAFAQAQFAQYGMPSAPDDMLAGYAKQILENKEQGQKIYEKLYETKVVEAVKAKIKVSEKSVSAEEFAKLAKEL
ncbi:MULTISPECIES: trigger factor [unclassified Alistipes]|jgi:trigger factor|uniref:trigger factor n=1 Tax=unclassified Alistipes TaxID=2608932 RepID=UPI000B39ED64|nr:trigger factor [Alistipes sp. An31A]OUO19968.1 trigger factor [Alistipes sp. An31A]HIV31841.1 trigger factor [Candidatus Alistipes excrementigallinarum]